MAEQGHDASSLSAIGIAGSYGGLNVGDEAILTAAIAQLGKEAPEADVVVFSRDLEHTREHYDVARVVDAREAVREELGPELERLDLLLLGGGGILYEREAASYLHVARLAQELDVPTATFAIGTGPLESRSERETVAEVLNRTKIVTVRELNDKRLLEEIGVERDIVVTADPALLLEPEPFDEELLKEEGITTDRHLIGISVREPGSAARNLEEGEYHKLLANAADFLVDRYEADVVFIPMERADLRESHKVVGEVAYPERCFVLKGSYSPRQLLGLMNHLEIAVGMRLHFLIFAALARVPLLALPYASKVSGFLEALELPSPEALQQEHAGLLIAAIDRLWEQRDEQRRQLDERLPRLQEQAARSLKICLEIAHGKPSSEVAQSEREEEERDTAAASA